jgi:hypothetical protein
MIKIEIVKANKSSKGLDIMTPVCNIVAEKMAKILTDKVLDLKCENHPDSTGVITITSTPNKDSSFEITKSSFCCLEFENSIHFQK